MKVLVTGAAGFVGTNLSQKLLSEGAEVVGVDNLGRNGVRQNLEMLSKNPSFTFHKRDIEDLPSVVYLERPDLVYHFAAQVAVTESVLNPTRDFIINAKGTFDVALAANKIGAPVIYTSTNKVFGDNVNKVPIVEEATRYDFGGELNKKGISENFSIDASHHTPYGCSKLVGDIYVREFGGISNRCSCMYGPNQFGIVDQGWLSHIAQKIIKGEQVTIYGDGKQLRDAVHSKDVVDLLLTQGRHLLEGRKDIRGEAFNVGGGYENTVSLLELCSRWNAPKDKINFEGWRPADQKVFYCDTSKAQTMLDWKPKVSLEEGLEDIYSWTKRNLSS